MLENQRKERIIGLLTENTTMSTSELSKRLYVSDATVRRDLADLEKAGRIHRVHGGAELVSGPGIQIPLTARDRENDTAKRNIAAKAIRFVHDGDTIFLDASSTCMRVVPLLSVRTGLTVVTNSPKAILELAGMHIRTISTGGLLLDESVAFVGCDAEDVIRRVNADVMLFSCRGVTEDGMVCDSSLEETSIRREMFARAKRKYLLCDSRKFGASYAFNICRVDDVDMIITEKGIENRQN